MVARRQLFEKKRKYRRKKLVRNQSSSNIKFKDHKKFEKERMKTTKKKKLKKKITNETVCRKVVKNQYHYCKQLITNESETVTKCKQIEISTTRSELKLAF